MALHTVQYTEYTVGLFLETLYLSGSTAFSTFVVINLNVELCCSRYIAQLCIVLAAMLLFLVSCF